MLGEAWASGLMASTDLVQLQPWTSLTGHQRWWEDELGDASSGGPCSTCELHLSSGPRPWPCLSYAPVKLVPGLAPCWPWPTNWLHLGPALSPWTCQPSLDRGWSPTAAITKPALLLLRGGYGTAVLSPRLQLACHLLLHPGPGGPAAGRGAGAGAGAALCAL